MEFVKNSSDVERIQVVFHWAGINIFDSASNLRKRGIISYVESTTIGLKSIHKHSNMFRTVKFKKKTLLSNSLI